ncbi:GGTA1 galactosyltransferase, partial [Polypterus senegalus]
MKRKWIILFACAVILILIYSFVLPSSLFNIINLSIAKTPSIFTTHNPTRHTFVAFSAFLDDRDSNSASPVIRVIGLNNLDHKEKVYCHVRCDSGVYSTQAMEPVLSNDIGVPSGVSAMICENRCGSASLIDIFVSTKHNHSANEGSVKILNTKEGRPTEFQHGLTVCINKVLDEYSNVLQLIQSIEMYRLLGVGKVWVYKMSCSDRMQQVLDYYAQDGFIEVLSWDISQMFKSSHKETLQHIQDIFSIDCVYRNMYTSKYVLLNGPEEILIPNQHENLTEMMEEMEHQHEGAEAFVFNVHVFSAVAPDMDSLTSNKQWPADPGLNILYYHFNKGVESDEKRMVINPRVIFNLDHLSVDYSGKWVKIPSDMAQLRLYQNPIATKSGEIPENEDKRLEHYKPTLAENLAAVLRSLPMLTENLELKWFTQWTHWHVPVVSENTFNREALNRHYKSKRLTIGLTVFALGKYLDYFLEQFLVSADKYFMTDHRVIIYVMVDEPSKIAHVEFGAKHSYKVFRIKKESRWQDISMMRMKTLSDLLSKYIQYEVDYLFCMDVDVNFIAPYGVETLGERVAQTQAWFFETTNEYFTYERRPESAAYIPMGEGDYYYHAASFGGTPSEVLKLVDHCYNGIIADKEKNIEAIWHDESHLNKYFLLNKPTKVLSPDYLWDFHIHGNENAKLRWVPKDYGQVREN